VQLTAEDRKEEMKSMNRFAGALMSRLLSASKSTATSSAPPSRVSVRLPTKRAHDGPQAKKTYGGRSSDLITSKLLSRQSPGTTPCQSTTGEREQLSAGGRSDTGLPPPPRLSARASHRQRSIPIQAANGLTSFHHHHQHTHHHERTHAACVKAVGRKSGAR
jgi:hypothetical protein